MTSEDYDEAVEQEHGSALDRVSAFQMGFAEGATDCAAIDMDEINQRRGDLPTSLQVEPGGSQETGEVPINKDTLSTLMEVLGKIFSPQQPPTLSYDPTNCPEAQSKSPAAYCPATNTVTVDLSALQKLGAVADVKEYVLPQGDDTALSVVILTAGDLDEAVSGLLTNRLVASDVNGETVPAGFTRITAFRSGVGGDEELCYQRLAENST